MQQWRSAVSPLLDLPDIASWTPSERQCVAIRRKQEALVGLYLDGVCHSYFAALYYSYVSLPGVGCTFYVNDPDRRRPGDGRGAAAAPRAGREPGRAAGRNERTSSGRTFPASVAYGTSLPLCPQARFTPMSPAGRGHDSEEDTVTVADAPHIG
jgi:hypothetical protein